jgi:hypothetical protein
MVKTQVTITFSFDETKIDFKHMDRSVLDALFLPDNVTQAEFDLVEKLIYLTSQAVQSPTKTATENKYAMKTKTFYLFGTDAVREFQESQDSKAVAKIIRNSGGQLYSIGLYDHSSELLSAYDGWNDFIELSEENFNAISDAL